MSTDSPLFFVLIGLGVYLTRLVPLLLALRQRTEAADSNEEPGSVDGWLGFVGPSVIAALLVTSVLPQPGQALWPDLSRTGAALLPTVAVAIGFKNLGLTVLVGVCSYGLASAVV